MNDDEKKPDMQSWVDPELEARIVAWVAGEASPFEISELERLIREKPELAIFKRRIEAVQGLVAEAVRPEKAPLKLSSEARDRLLKAMGASESPAAPAPADKPADPSFAVYLNKQRAQRRWMLAVAACLVGALILSVSFSSFKKIGTSSYDERLEQSASEKRVTDHQGLGAVLREPRGLASVDLPANNRAHDLDTFGKLEKGADEERRYAVAAPGSPARVAGQFAVAPEGIATKPSLPPAPAFPVSGAQDFASAPQTLQSVSTVSNLILEDAHVSNARSINAASVAEGASVAAVAVGGQSSDSSSFGVQASNNQSQIGDGANVSGTQDQISLKTENKQQALGESENAPAQADDKEATLEAFTVTPDLGNYKGNSTLAGSRAKTDLKDAGDAVTVVTAQTLQDAAGGAGKKTEGLGAAEPSAQAKIAPVVSPTPVPADEEKSASKEPVSTFSLHVSDVSFRLAQDALARGEVPDPSRIRPEEFYNAFDYGDPAPSMAEKVSCRIEQAADPAKQQRNLVRIAMRVPATGHGAGQPLRLTVLLDTSGSMEREDRAAAVHRAMAVLVSLLGPRDQITLVAFARQPRLLAERVAGDKASQLLDIIAHTPSEGGTNLEEALKLAGELARRQFLARAQNRIVVLTDGAANLGNADPGQLAASITALRQEGISFDACGVGIDGINDEVLEALTRKGAGRYYVVDTPESADAGFARQLAGGFRPAAENVKVQVRFNPARVGAYRLIGFEQHRLNEADFRNDKVEAAALAAGEAAVALYEIEPLPQGEGELGEVFVRFRDTAAGAMVERSWTLPYDPYAPALDRASPTMQLAGASALMAEKLRGGAAADAIRLDQLAPIVNALRGRYAQEARVQALVAMFEEMRRLEKQ